MASHYVAAFVAVKVILIYIGLCINYALMSSVIWALINPANQRLARGG